MNRTVFLYGGGGHAKVVKECLDEKSLFGFVDDNPTAVLFDLQHLGVYQTTLANDADIIIAIGNNETRLKVSKKISHAFANAIHPSALISNSSSIGVGCMVFHRVIVQASTRVGNHVILNTAAQVDHDSVIGDYVHIGPGAILCGDVQVGEGSFVGAGAIILPGVRIGKWSTIGAGSVVIRDVPDNVLMIGVPASAKQKL